MCQFTCGLWFCTASRSISCCLSRAGTIIRRARPMQGWARAPSPAISQLVSTTITRCLKRSASSPATSRSRVVFPASAQQPACRTLSSSLPHSNAAAAHHQADTAQARQHLSCLPHGQIHRRIVPRSCKICFEEGCIKQLQSCPTCATKLTNTRGTQNEQRGAQLLFISQGSSQLLSHPRQDVEQQQPNACTRWDGPHMTHLHRQSSTALPERMMTSQDC